MRKQKSKKAKLEDASKGIRIKASKSEVGWILDEETKE